MFGYARLFRSRWSALLWAAGIVWFAYDTAESQPQGDANCVANAEQATDATGSPVTGEAEKRLAEAINSF
jgi:hypothetical protein